MLIRDGIEDLEILLNRVYDKEIKELVKEAIGCYSQGFYRASIISLWNAIIYDSYKKAKYLIEYINDSNSIQLLEEINHSATNKNYSREIELLSKYLHEKLNMISKHDIEQFENIQRIRNACSHPSFVKDNEIFNPYPEEVRACIRIAVEKILSKEPLVGKEIIKKIVTDTQGLYFANSYAEFEKALYLKYLNQTDSNTKLNLLKLSTKKYLKEEIDKKVQLPYGRILFSIASQNPELITKENLGKIINETSESNFYNLLVCILKIADLDKLFDEHLLINLKAYLENTKELNKGILLAGKFILSNNGKCYTPVECLAEISENITSANYIYFVHNLVHYGIVISNVSRMILLTTFIELIENITGFQSAENFIIYHLVPILPFIKEDKIINSMFTAILENKRSSNNQFLNAGQKCKNLENIFKSLHPKILEKSYFNDFLSNLDKKYFKESESKEYQELLDVIKKRKENNTKNIVNS